MSEAHFFYRAYGLSLASDFELCEAVQAKQIVPDVCIKDRPIEIDVPDFEGFRDYRTIGEGDLLTYRDVGRFLLRDDRTIDVDLDGSFDRRLIGLPLLGPVMALHLHRRGALVLHGSAVLIDGRAHVFLGDKGAGKSTTAANLVAAGFPLVSDDVIAIERLGNGRLGIRAGYPAAKLDLEMIALFDDDAVSVLPPNDGSYTQGKTRVRFNAQFPVGLVELGKVYCLARGAEHAVRPLSADLRLHALLRFAHYPRLGPQAHAPHEAVRLFQLATRLAPEISLENLIVKQGRAEVASLGSFLAPKAEDVTAVG